MYEQYIFNAYDFYEMNHKIENIHSKNANDTYYVDQLLIDSSNLDTTPDQIFSWISCTIDSLKQTLNEIINKYLKRCQRKHVLTNGQCDIGSVSELLESAFYKHMSTRQCDSMLAGRPPLELLDQIQNWFESLAEIILSTINNIDKMRKFAFTNFDHFNMIDTAAKGLLSDLISSSFVLEKQPPQVMKTKSKYDFNHLQINKKDMENNLVFICCIQIWRHRSFSTDQTRN